MFSANRDPETRTNPDARTNGTAASLTNVKDAEEPEEEVNNLIIRRIEKKSDETKI